MGRKTKRIHVNQWAIRKNRSAGTRDPVITCKSYDENQKGSRVKIFDQQGNVAAEVVYDPDTPLPCGAVCWVETRNEVEVT